MQFQPTSHQRFSELLSLLLSLEMLDIKNVKNQECGLKPQAHYVIQMLIGGIFTNIEFLLPIQRKSEETSWNRDDLQQKNKRLTYNIQTYIHMYNYMHDELIKLWDVAPLQQSELMSQIERLRAYIQRHLQKVEQEIKLESQLSSNKKNNKRTKKQQEKLQIEQIKEATSSIMPVSVITPSSTIPVVMPILLPSLGSSAQALKQSSQIKGVMHPAIPQPMPIISIVNPLVAAQPTLSKELSRKSESSQHKIFMTERIEKTHDTFKIQPVEPQNKFIFSIEIKKDQDEEVRFQQKDTVDPNVEKRQPRSRQCKEKKKQENDSGSEYQDQDQDIQSFKPMSVQKRELLEQSDLNPSPVKAPRLTTKRQNQMLKNSTNKPSQNDFNYLDLKLGSAAQYQLVQCNTYESFESQPYRIYFTFEVQMLMYIHSYLSKHEVIGLLGGITYQRENIKYLVISKIYNAESCIQSQTVRLKNCEISDEEQIKIQDLMDKDGVQKLAWYHSHPIFEVDPSIQDLVTHYSQQVNFDRQGLPFFGVIVGPYLQKQDVTETQLTVFNLKEENKNLPTQRQARLQNLKDRARQYKYKIIPKTKLKYSMYNDIKKMIKSSSTHKCDKPDLASEWTKQRSKVKYTFKDKFMLSLKRVCEQNYQQAENFDFVKEIRDMLLPKDQNTLDMQLSSNDVVAPFQLILRQQLQQSSEHAALLQKHQKTKFFSIGDGKKISKYLTKIEQALIKEFKLDNATNLMEQTYIDHKQQEIDKINNEQKKIQIQELRNRQIVKDHDRLQHLFK